MGQFIMELKLTRPICFFDLETTGIEVAKDRIVEIDGADLAFDTWTAEKDLKQIKN